MFAEPQKASTHASTQNANRSNPFFQAEVKVGKADDPAEKEADAVAEQVVASSTEQPTFFTTPKPNPPAVQVQKKQDPEEEEELQLKESGQQVPRPGREFADRLNSAQATGQPMPADARREMEGGFGADFSGVRIHTDQNAAQLNDEVGARAFAYGNHVFFNQGQFQPSSRKGKHLLAHELTHTIQQGAVKQTTPTVSRKPKQVQRGLLDSAWNAVSGAVRSAADWAEDQLSAGVDWLKEQAASFVRNIPGYTALTVVLGQDPVTGTDVARNGHNFIRAGLNIIPGGAHLQQKLNENGALDEAATWLDGQIAELDLNLPGIFTELNTIWRSLGIGDVRNPRGVLQRIANVFTSRLTRLATFAGNVARYFLQIIKRFVIRELAEYVKNRTRAYPLMKMALGYDPITGDAVERTPQLVLQAVLGLTENGQQIYEQLVSSGALDRALAYMTSVGQRALALANLARTNFLEAWELITIENLMTPAQTFLRIVNLIAEPAIGLVRLVVSVARDFLLFVKDALLSYLGRVAARLPGFTLLTVILGRNPLTGQRVARTPQRLIRGFFEIIPGGMEYYNQLQEAGAINRMLAWISNMITQFFEIWSSIVTAFRRLWNTFSWADLARPLEAFQQVVDIVRRPVQRIVAFVAEVIKQVVLIMLQIMNFPIDLINRLIQNVARAINDIKRDPVGFLRNLLRAVKQGFVQFFDNIFTHLLSGVAGWLFGQLENAGITPPADLSFRSIFGMVMQVLGITAERIWQKIVRKLGPERAARLQLIMNTVQGVWSFVRDVMQRGPIAIWEKIQQGLNNLWQMVLDGVKNWVITRVIQRVTARLLSMLDPTGIMAVVNSFISIFRAIQWFVEQARRMLELMNAIAEGVVQIAQGNVQQAATFLESALARALPIIISFLANQVGLGDIGRRIGEMIGRVRQRIDRVLDRIIDRAFQLGRSVLNAARRGVNAVRNWWQTRKQLRTQDGHQHTLSFSGRGSSARLMVASRPTPIVDFVNNFKAQNNLSDAQVNPVLAKAREVDRLVRQTVPAAQRDTHNAGIDTKMNEISTALAALPATSAPATSITYGGLQHGFGSATRANYLDSRHPEGSAADSNKFDDQNGYYRKINQRRKGSGAFYVRGHLLNDNVGGPGNDWKNLTPLSQDTNGQHKRLWENDLKTAVNGSSARMVGRSDSGPSAAGYAKNVSVMAVYGRSEPASLQTLKGDDDNMPAGWKDEWDIQKVIDVLEAEKGVPRQLVCTSTIKMRTGNERAHNRTIQNDIQHGSLGSYSFSAQSKERIKFADIISNASNRQTALSALQRYRGIGRVRAENILNKALAGGRISNFKNAYGVTKKELERRNPGKTFQSGSYSGSNRAVLQSA